ncbi:LacI family DNA-binding transcriptional regulator [Kutzneria buriramensis]|uniref:DNA-binding LacI/PurR family transcriptional regulator n=1 Tax=Kutzneria buriramensis TaxID=1045776 RepID=A0A3E0GVX9_9PSEU|nr:LacI family DNA-binding transcriptional regulator [Kutzneria buriramensis]REH29663.1 DNA-binding LacI/PurR family transcriptional regulator [Kutzneria buriramensis]
MVTIIDVARAAGVAPSTVSYVLNGKRPISADTRRQVEQCIRQLGYRPPGRRTPAPRQRTGVLGLLAPLRPGANVSALTRFVSATMVAARARNHDLLLLTHDAGVSGLRRTMATAVADALIVMDVQSSDPRIPALLTLDRPVVLVGEPDLPTGLSCVGVDFAAAVDRAVRHLANLGHRSVGIVGAPLPAYARGGNYPRRFTRAFTAAAGSQGLRTRWRPCGDSAEAVDSCLDALLAEGPDITALVVENEVVLPLLVERLHRRGRRVPEDVSLLAVCHDDAADRPPLRLTSVTLPTVELGQLAVETALGQVDPPATRLLAPELTVRESTGPAAATSSCA